MGVDYYNELKVGRNVMNGDLKKAYMKLDVNWNPNKNPNNKKEVEAKFKQIYEAYEAGNLVLKLWFFVNLILWHQCHLVVVECCLFTCHSSSFLSSYITRAASSKVPDLEKNKNKN